MRPATVVCPGPNWKPQIRGTCGACGRQLDGRLTWFCRSVKWFGATTEWCRTLYMANHRWADAREVALWRASTSMAETGRPPYVRSRPVVSCVRDGCGETSWPEVNHVLPLNGSGYAMGCQHHQDDLEVLCHPHHVDETCRQRGFQRKRLTSRTESGQLPLVLS